jgi:repressor LexA
MCPFVHVPLNSMQLTDKQQAVLDFLEDQLLSTGIMPSTREIQSHFGYSSQTAAINHLRALESKGAIQRLPGKARALTLPSIVNRSPIREIPIYGSIAAGMAEMTEENIEGSVAFDETSLSPGCETFALRVRGDSMIDAQIADGDVVILEKREAQSGDIVAALIDGETTLKRYLMRYGKPCLRAENANYPDLIPARELLIQGVMVALIRHVRRR